MQTRIFTQKKLASSVIAACSLALAPNLMAAQLEEVMVTAQKRTESLQDVPVAVTAFSGDDLQNFGVSGTAALQATVPGLVFSNTGALAQPYLRGVGTRLAISGLEPSVAVYVDDRYNSRTTSSMFDFADVERVEVLKGPQGVLFGRNVTGGAIRIITKDVMDELEGSVTAGVGDYDYRSLSGTVNVPISDSFGARVTGLTRKRDGYVDNIFPGGASELDDQDTWAVRGKLRWDMTDMVTARLTMAYSEVDDLSGKDQTDLSPFGLNTGIAAGGIRGEKPDKVATAINEDDNSDSFTSQLRFDVAFDSLDFVSVTTYSDFEQQWSIDADGTSAAMTDVPAQGEETKETSQEFQLLSNTDAAWSWILGANYYTSEVDYDGKVVVANGAVSLSQGAQNVETTAYAAFGQTTWNMNDAWALTAGGRWSYEEKKVEVKNSPLDVDFTVQAFKLPYKDDQDWDEVTPRVTLEYNTDTYMAYLTYARGFKSGGYNHPAHTNSDSGALDPEILDMYELGLKGDFLDDTLRLSTSLYYYDYSDLQVTRAAAGDAALLVTENAADAEIWGLDIDATWIAGENLTIIGGMNLLDTEYKDYETTAKVFNSVITGDPTAAGMRDVIYDASGESMLRSPDFSGFVSVQYDFHAGDARVPVSITYSYKDEFDFDFVADPLSEGLTQDSYSLLNARISYISPSEAWTAALWGNNLTDEEYFDDIVGAGAGLRGSYAAPRTYGVDLTYNF